MILLNMKKILLLALLIPLFVCAQNRPRVSILGDSYSTFQGYIPEGNEAWYYAPVDTSRTDVENVTQTWWWQVYSARAFVTRLPRLGSPDVIFIFGGTNDDWAGAELGEYQYENFTRSDLYTYRPALAYLFQQAKERYPNVKIFFLINDILSKELKGSTIIICNHYDIPYIEFKDIDKKLQHPTIKGMKAMAQQVLDYLNK